MQQTMRNKNLDLVKAYQMHPENREELATKLILQNKGMICEYAKKMAFSMGSDLEIEDLYQEGCIAVLEAAEKFDVNSGNSFATLCHYYFLKYMYSANANTGHTIRIPSNLLQQVCKFILLDHCLLEQDINERKKILEKELGISEDNLNNTIYAARFLHIASIDQPITDKVGDEFTFHEIFFDKEEPLIEDIAVNELDQSNLSKLLDRVMSACLSEKEITCLIEYYYEEMTLDQIGERYKLSRERIRQIIATAKRKIRHYSKAHACYLSAYLD